MNRRKEEDGERQADRSKYTRGLFVCSRKVLICEVHGVYTRVCAYELQRVSSSEACTGTANCARPEVEGRERGVRWWKEEVRERWEEKCGEQRVCANVHTCHS